MPLEKQIGDAATALSQNQYVDALDGTYWISGWDATLGTGDLEVDIAPGEGAINTGGVETGETQTVDFDGDPDADDPRKAVISVDDTGTVQKTLGDAVPAEPEAEIRERTFDPAPPTNAPGVVVAEVWLGAATTALVSEDVRDRRVSNNAVEEINVTLPFGANVLGAVAPLPGARRYAACASGDGRSFVVGGRSPDGITDTLFEYQESDELWVVREPRPDEAAESAAAYADGRLYSIAGQGGDSGRTADAYEYDPNTDSWSAISPLPDARFEHAAVGEGGKVYVISGRDAGNQTQDDLFEYDPSEDSWTTLAPIPTEVNRHAAAVVDGEIYITGGIDGDNNRIDAVQKYSISTDSWTAVEPLPEAIYSHGAGTLNGFVYTVAGSDADNNTIKKMYRYDPNADSWSTVEELPTVRREVAVGSADGYILAIGGRDDDDNILTDSLSYFRAAIGR